MGDAFLQKQVADSLIGWLLPEAEARDFNMESLEGNSTSLTDVLSRCGNLPFLADHRVVMVRHAELLESMGKTADGAAPRGKGSPSKRLADALPELPASTTLILARSAETPEAGARKETPRCINAAVDKAIDKHGLLIDCTVGIKAEPIAIAAVNHEAARRGIAMARGAGEYLVKRAGNDIAYLMSELEKCSLRAGPEGEVTKTVIDEMTPQSPRETIFNLMDALGNRNSTKALSLLRELLDGGQAPEQMLSMFANHLRELMQARALIDARVALDAGTAERVPPSLAAQLPKNGLVQSLARQGWKGSRLTSQARNFSPDQLQFALSEILGVDLAIKGLENEGGSAELLLQLFLAKMC
jgi:DNA polymerase-3 subunit delta